MNEQWGENNREGGWIDDVLQAFLTSGETIEEDECFYDSPERRLVRAVLVDAFATVLNSRAPSKCKQQRALDLSWIERDEPGNSGLTFTRACVMLDLDPGYMRKQLWKKLNFKQAA